MILSFRTDRSGQTGAVWSGSTLLANSPDPDQTEEAVCSGLHCLPFWLRLFDTFLYGKATLLKSLDNYSSLVPESLKLEPNDYTALFGSDDITLGVISDLSMGQWNRCFQTSDQ